MKKLLLLLALFCFGGSLTAEASHVMGAELTVTHFNGPQYKVQLRFWRFTNGIAAPQTWNLEIQNLTNLAYLPNQVLTLDSSVTISPNYAQEFFYSSTVTFPTLTDRYFLSVEQCCRNFNITNLGGGSLSSNYLLGIVTIFTPLSAGFLNSSPRFLLPPEPFAPLNQPYVHGPFGFDPDGDSLVYRLDTPLTLVGGSMQNISAFIPLYLINNPLFNFDSQTGTFNWTPSSLGFYQYTYTVEEWRNGQLIGTVMRDMQLSVVNNTLNSTPPSISINGNTLTGFALPQLTAFAGSPFNFSINITDPDPTIKSFRFTGAMFQGSNAAVITTSGTTDGISSNINWTPPQSMISNKVHMLHVRYIEATSLYSFSSDIPILITVQPAVAGLVEVQGGVKELHAFVNESGHVQMNFTLSEASDMSIYAYDVQGRKLAKFSEGAIAKGQHQFISDKLAAHQGLIILRAEDGKGWQKTLKLIKP